jgi:hypothetical protein
MQKYEFAAYLFRPDSIKGVGMTVAGQAAICYYGEKCVERRRMP